jgi:hypothetical protein
MNKDKVGEPFQYPNTFLLSYLVMLKYTFIYHIDRHRGYCTRGHARGKVSSIPDYTTISRRINKLNLKLKDESSSKEYIKDD